ncbi:hypothetical protein BRC64_12685 [Halobacteriales archaeon QH_10_67_22]|nr:MAG: hypothetical protein BRC64_12685 [Halobacteriales archaeon QH_10_67_22]
MSDGQSAVDGVASAVDTDVSDWLSLDPGEEVQWVGGPTNLRIISTVVWGIVLIPFLLGLLILLFAPLTYLNIKNTDYVLTNRSLYVKEGVLSTSIETVDLDRIQNTDFTQSFWGKQLGFGTIEVSTAGSSGADISFSGVEEAREVRDRIARAQREYAGGDRGTSDGTGGGGSVGQTAGADQLDQVVAELRATREALERVEAKLGDADGNDRSGAPSSHRAADDTRSNESGPVPPSEQETTIDQSDPAGGRSDSDRGQSDPPGSQSQPAGGQSGPTGGQTDDSTDK